MNVQTLPIVIVIDHGFESRSVIVLDTQCVCVFFRHGSIIYEHVRLSYGYSLHTALEHAEFVGSPLIYTPYRYAGKFRKGIIIGTERSALHASFCTY